MNQGIINILGFVFNAFIVFLLTFVDLVRVRIDPEHSTIAEFLYLDGRDAMLSFLLLLIPARDLRKITGRFLYRLVALIGSFLKYLRQKV